jgi:hypothetical protein
LFVWLTIVCLVVLGTMLITGTLPFRSWPGTTPPGGKWTRALSFTEVAQIPPFTATVESKYVGERGASSDSQTRLPAQAAAPTPYVLVHLVKWNGRLAIYQENPTSNQVTFVSHLRVGGKYKFPAALPK